MKPSPKLLLVAGLAFAAGLGACSSGLARIVGVSAHDVYITPGRPQPGPQGDSVYFNIQNNGGATAYLSRCGDEPALTLQVFQNGNWVNTGPAVSCPSPSTPGPIELAPGASIVLVEVFPSPGHYRGGVSAATTADLADAAQAWTVGFDIP